MQEQSKEFVWDRNHHSIFETFALDLQDFTTTYKTPPYGSQDVNYGLELQKLPADPHLPEVCLPAPENQFPCW